MQRIGVVSVLHQLVGDLIGFPTGTTKDNGIVTGAIVDNALQGRVAISGLNHVIFMAYIFSPGIQLTNGHLNRIRHIPAGNIFDFS